jgi:hypothetical protein
MNSAAVLLDRPEFPILRANRRIVRPRLLVD